MTEHGAAICCRISLEIFSMKTVIIINPFFSTRYTYQAVGLKGRIVTWVIRKLYKDSFTLPDKARFTTVPPTTLMVLRALFEMNGCRAVAFDEQVEEIDFGLDADLVCLSATTPQYERAVQIGARFRERGIPVAIGGIHATLLPDECRDRFDVVCLGEAEGYLDRLVRDLSEGRLQSLYQSDAPVDMDKVPFIRNDLSVGRYFPVHAVSFSRGCNFHCDFCSIQAVKGRHRTRSIESVVNHIAESGEKEIYFPDAALTGNHRKARELFKALIPLKIKWWSSVPLDVCLKEDMLDLMAESGCWLVVVGFETLSEKGIEVSGKRQNKTNEYERVIRLLHDRNITIKGNFVFGFDGDTEDVFEKTAKFTVDTGIDFPEFMVLTPFPGTRLFQRLDDEGRILDRNWSNYEYIHFEQLPVFQPSHMSREVLRDGCRMAEKIAYSPMNTVRRLRNAGVFRPWVYLMNLALVERFRNNKYT